MCLTRWHPTCVGERLGYHDFGEPRGAGGGWMRSGLTNHLDAIPRPGSARHRRRRHSLRPDHDPEADARARARRRKDRLAHDRFRAPSPRHSQPRGHGCRTPVGTGTPRREQLQATRRRMGSWVRVHNPRMLGPTCATNYRLSGRMAGSRGQVTHSIRPERAQHRWRERMGRLFKPRLCCAARSG
jgi:hypothetical protein